MKLHNDLKNEDCIGQKVTANIPIGLQWVDYPDNYIGGVITPDGIEAHEPNNDYRDVYVKGGLLAFCQGEICEIKAFDEAASTVTLINNDPDRSLSTGGYNATEFTIPYEWYSACFGTDWKLNIDGDLKQHISEAKQTILNLIEAHKALYGTEKAFERLSACLHGYNEDGELFDFAYDIKCGAYDIISTITLRDGALKLSDDCEVWHGDDQMEMHYKWEAPSQSGTPDIKKPEKPSVLDAIRADREKPHLPHKKEKGRADIER